MKMKIFTFGAGLFLAFAGLFYLVLIPRSESQNHFEWKLISEAEPMFEHAGSHGHLFFFNKENGIAVSALTIGKTHDGGKSWVSVRDWDQTGFHGLVFTDNQHGWIVGSEKEKPLILKTTNKGLNWQDWQKVNFDKKSQSDLDGKIIYFLDICFDPAGKSWIVGKGGIVEAVADAQKLKVLSVFSTAEILYSVSCNDSGEVWAVGQNAVFHYRNGWNRKEIDKKYFLARVKSDGNDVWILGGDNSKPEADEAPGILLRSRDNGLTWENKTPESASTLYDLYLKDGKGWLVGAKGSIYYTSNNGNSWTKSKSPTQSDLLYIFFLDSNNGWISGDRGTILKYQN